MDSPYQKGLRVLVVPDTQAKPGVDLSYMSWIGEYIVSKRPDVIVHLGDAFDFPSLSSYDKGKLSFEGRRLREDIAVGKESLERLLLPLRQLQQRQKFFKKKVYQPRMVFCLGNHCERLARVAQTASEFEGFIGYELLGLEDMGWEVHDFLKPVEIQGINFVHYLANPFTGRPFSGSAMNQLKNVGKSFVVGHKQTLDVAIRPTLDGSMQIGIVCGACYPFPESYKGHQGNHHFRGLILLNDAHDGYADACFVSLSFLERKFGDKND